MTPREMQEALDALAAGDLDRLTIEQIDALETHLNANAHAAAEFGRQRPKPDAFVRAAEVSVPSAAQWDQVWSKIDAAGESHAHETARTIKLWNAWRPAAAAAACALMIGLWSYFSPRAAVADWPIELDENAEILSVEVFGDDSSFVLEADCAAKFSVIWVVPESQNTDE